MGLEERILELLKQLGEETRLADKRAKQLYGFTATNIKASAYRSFEQSDIPTDTWIQVQLDSEIYDPGNNFADYKFIVPVNGIYSVKALVTFKSVVASKSYMAGVKHNTVYKIAGRVHSSFVDWVSPFISRDIKAQVGDTFGLYAYHNAGVNTVDIVGDAGGLYTFMTVHILSLD